MRCEVVLCVYALIRNKEATVNNSGVNSLLPDFVTVINTCFTRSPLRSERLQNGCRTDSICHLVPETLVTVAHVIQHDESKLRSLEHIAKSHLAHPSVAPNVVK